MRPWIAPLLALLMLGCATDAGPTLTEVYQRQAYAGLSATSFGPLSERAGDLSCDGYTASGRGFDRLLGKLTQARHRIPARADKKIVDEHLSHHFLKLVGATARDSLLDSGGVVAIIDSDDDHVTFWRVVEEVPFAEIEAAAAGYCRNLGRNGTAAFTGQAIACTQSWPTPVSVGGKTITVRLSHAIANFRCLK